MAAATTCTRSLLDCAAVLKARRTGARPIAAGKHYDQDWVHSCLCASQRLAQPWLVSKSHFSNGNGRRHHAWWNFCSSSESSGETKVSEREESSLAKNVESLDGSTTSSKDVENTNNHTNSPVEELLPLLVAETVEVAAQTVSSVGEIEAPIPVEEPTINHATAVKTVIFWVCSAITFGVFIWLKDGSGKASEFFAGYIVEQSLSVDNLFVFVIIFKFFQVPIQYQSRILTYGISGAIVFRATMILLGVASIQKFEAVNLFFASILIFTSYKATPLFLTLAVIELSDIAFAVDSIPAVFGVTRDPFIVFSSNIFAILGLRSLYTVISSSMGELEYIQPSVAVVLGFIGSKMVADFFGIHISREVSLGVVVSVLGLGVGLSLWKKQKADEE